MGLHFFTVVTVADAAPSPPHQPPPTQQLPGIQLASLPATAAAAAAAPPRHPTPPRTPASRHVVGHHHGRRFFPELVLPASDPFRQNHVSVVIPRVCRGRPPSTNRIGRDDEETSLCFVNFGLFTFRLLSVENCKLVHCFLKNACGVTGVSSLLSGSSSRSLYRWLLFLVLF